jgi:hypothetical protein
MDLGLPCATLNFTLLEDEYRMASVGPMAHHRSKSLGPTSRLITALRMRANVLGIEKYVAEASLTEH